jgi:hypothetical protein
MWQPITTAMINGQEVQKVFTTEYTTPIRFKSWRGVLDTTLCDKVYQSLATGRWFSVGTPVSSTNKTDRHYINQSLQVKRAQAFTEMITK